ncbi:selenocysteine-specific translation elongation factor [Alphaproteobacteria bacterium]|nr:selenocysteine-specific translation elongation factor [Alphaproteobacteria bacterium]
MDHGKTELVKALTGIDTDRLPEERARGLSVDLGFAYHTLPDNTILGFVDVPGHEKFIRNMLAGVAGIDLGLLVVAADDGVMPQTREHLAILNLMDIRQYIVALTKIDRVSFDRVDDVADQVDRLLTAAGHEGVIIYPVCAPENKGIGALMKALKSRVKEASAWTAEHHFRMAIDRVFTLNGVGLVVTGMVFSGAVHNGESMTLSTDGSQVRVRGIRAHNTASDVAKAGERCAINIVGRGLSEALIRRGNWLMHPSLYAPTRRIDVEVQVLASETGPLKHWTPTHLHIGADHLSARVAVLSGGAIPAGGQGLAQLVVSRDAFAVHGDTFVLRDQSAQRTIAGGRVIDPFSPKRGRARPARIAALNALQHQNVTDALRALTEGSETGVLLAPFSVAYNLPGPRLDMLIETLSLRRVGQQSKQRAFCETQWRRLAAKVVKAVEGFHRSKPMSPGASIKDIQLALSPHIETSILEDSLGTLIEEQRLNSRGTRFHLPSHSIQISGRDQQLLDRVASILAPRSGTPLSLHQAAADLQVDMKTLEMTLKTASRIGEMVLIGKNRYAPTPFVAKLGVVAEQLAANSADGYFTTAEYRDQTKLGRNFAIEVLEYFDRVGFTERNGNTRCIRRSVTDVFAVSSDS